MNDLKEMVERTSTYLEKECKTGIETLSGDELRKHADYMNVCIAKIGQVANILEDEANQLDADLTLRLINNNEIKTPKEAYLKAALTQHTGEMRTVIANANLLLKVLKQRVIIILSKLKENV